MHFTKRDALRAVLCAALAASGLPARAANTNVSGVEFANQLQLAGSKLELNGAGVRWKFVVKVYAAGLYLSSKADSTEAVLAAPGPKQLRIVMLRKLEADQLSQLFMRGIGRNLKPSEALRLTQTLLTLSQNLNDFREFNTGDVLTINFDPKQGTVFHAGGRPVGAPIPGSAVFNAAMQIWLGHDPADMQLKDALLGRPVATAAPVAAN